MICLIIFIVYRCAKDHSNTSRQENRATAEEVPMYSCNNLNSNTDNLTAKDIEVLIY
eukprot:GAHX01005891.1.p1 GENE.GAHX01005891.1~~GAHX01005891.1.p1  ORF type:complete len:57 (+),score=6.96 GAHX01005891.1:3-173(+)